MRTYGKALLALFILLCLSVCGNLSLLVFKELRDANDPPALPPPPPPLRPPAPPSLPTSEDTPVDSPVSVPGLKRCAVAPSGAEACWELADPAMTVISNDILQGITSITGTLRVGPAVQTISVRAFAASRLTGLDLSEATSLVEIGRNSFLGTDLAGTLVIPAKVTRIGRSAFQDTKLTGLDLSKANSLVEIEDFAFRGIGQLEGTLVIPDTVRTIGNSVFEDTKLTGLDLPKATWINDSILNKVWRTSLPTSATDTPAVVPEFMPGLKRCAVAPSGGEACWELADPALTVIPEDILQGNTDITGTLRVGPAVKTISARAFEDCRLTGLDLSEATSLVEIGRDAFVAADLAGTLVIPAKVTRIGRSAFQGTKLTGLDLSKANSLVEIGDSAFLEVALKGTLVIPATVRTIGSDAFAGRNAKLTSLDLSKATSLVEIEEWAFFEAGVQGTLVIPAKVATIGEAAFKATKLTGLNLSKATSLVEIADHAFDDTSLEPPPLIPATVATIGSNSFGSSRVLKNEKKNGRFSSVSFLDDLVSIDEPVNIDEIKASTTWWMSLRTKVREVGDEAVKAKLEEFDDEVNRLRAQPQAINEAPEDSSEDEDEGTYSSPGEWAPMPLSLALSDR